MTGREVLRKLLDNSAGCVCIEYKEGECPCEKEIDQALTALVQIEERERLTEDDIYEILITQLPMRVYLSIPSPKLKEIATFIYQAQAKKRERREGSG